MIVRWLIGPRRLGITSHEAAQLTSGEWFSSLSALIESRYRRFNLTPGPSPFSAMN
jgi:hypothetical protein